MKLTLLCPDLLGAPNSGIPVVTAQMLRQLEIRAGEARVPLSLEIWALHDKPARAEELCRAIGLQSPPRRFRAFKGDKLALLAAAALADKPDLALTTHIGMGPAARLLKGPRTRLVQFIHGIECWRPLPLRQRVGLDVTDGLLSNSAFTHARFVEHNPVYGALPNHVCWLGASRERISMDEPAPPPPGAPPSVLIVGRICGEERYKGHEELVAIWPMVRQQVPDARLDIVGTGNAEAALRARAERLGLVESGAVRFWGRVSNEVLRERYRAASVFAMPSRGEGFGLVYLEAMAAARPCVASYEDAAREVVLEGETGLLVRYGDREGLCRVLVELLCDPEKRDRLGRAGRARVLAHFTEDQFGARVWEALGHLVPAWRLAEAG
jgi:phosphatidylinositol alpha-1,6-mannosyltransferase